MKNKTYTVNTTIKINGEYLHQLENYLRSLSELEVINFKLISDTTRLYEEDATFKKLVKAEKQAREAKEDYINKIGYSNL